MIESASSRENIKGKKSFEVNFPRNTPRPSEKERLSVQQGETEVEGPYFCRAGR